MGRKGQEAEERDTIQTKGWIGEENGVKTWVGKAAGKLKENRKMTEKWFIYKKKSSHSKSTRAAGDHQTSEGLCAIHPGSSRP